VKKILTRIAAVFLVVLMLFTAASCGAPADSGDTENAAEGGGLNIGIIKWLTHGALDSAEEGFVTALADNGYADGEAVTIDYQNANNDPNIAATIADRFVNNNCDLVLAIATPAVQSMQGKTTTIPIIGTAVTDFVEAGLVEANDAPGGNITGASDLTPVAEQFDLLMKVLPDVKTVGILFNSSEANSQIQVDTATEVADARGLSIVTRSFSSVNDIPQAVESLAKEIDAFWLPTDNTIASAIAVVADTAAEQNIPLVCSEENQVIGGGTFTIGIDYYELGYQAGEMAVRILKDGANPAEMPIEYLQDMSICINKEAADRIGIVFPADILADATDVSAAGQ
jgi:putative ABC transport system substrate-binding protein